ncbi:MAG: glycosyltransferase family 2 protein [Candidatus Falkowbacteria bacterium]|nr:glycosyltransferase family 2 protein [Candidatus Falkowbacteria bacterium]
MKLVIGLVAYGDSSLKYFSKTLPALQAALSFLPDNNFLVKIFDNSEPGDYRNQELIATSYPDFQFLSRSQNLGFARAYNILIRSAKKDGATYFLMLNPDVLLEKDTIKKLIEFLDGDGSISSACPKLYRWPFPKNPEHKIIDTCGLVLSPGLRFSDLGQGKVDDGSFDNLEIIGPSGAAGIFRLSALLLIATGKAGEEQYFDERMFMYKEDCDLAYRLFLAGQRSACVSEAAAWHDRSAADPGQGFIATLRDRKNKSKNVRRWSFVNQHLLFSKHFSRQNLFSKAIIIKSSLGMFIFALFREPFLMKEYYSIFTNIKENYKNKDR